jgi:hypothetical protein
VKINYATLLPIGIAALVCLLTYGSLLLWAGFHRSGQAHPPDLLLRMPSGLLIGGLCLAAGLLFGFLSARDFATEAKGWYKGLLSALTFLMSGGFVFSLLL